MYLTGLGNCGAAEQVQNAWIESAVEDGQTGHRHNYCPELDIPSALREASALLSRPSN
jgi:hypothetical protein